MARVSFMQTSFLGGRWSATAQGRMNDPAYKTALSECLNAYPLEEGAWTRRPGFRYLAHTRAGAKAVVKTFDWNPAEPYVLEFTDSVLRIFSQNEHVIDSSCNVLDISTDQPAVVTVDAVPDGWSNGDTVIFGLANDPCGPQAILCNRQFTVGDCLTTTFTLKNPFTGAGIDGSTIGYVAGALPDTAKKIVELATPYTADELDAIRIVSDDSTVLILHGSHEPRKLSKADDGTWSLATQDFTDGPYLDIQDPKVSLTTLTLSGGSYDQGDSVTVTASAVTGINNDTGFQTTDVGRLIRFRAAPPVWDKNTTYAKGDQVSVLDEDDIFTAQGGITGLDPTLDDGTHWQISAAKVNWIALKITSRTSTTVVHATIQSDVRENGSFSSASGNSNIRAAIGESGFPMLDAKMNQIDFTALFAVGQGVSVTNGAFTDGAGGDISADYTVRGVWNDPDDNRSLLQFTDDGGKTADWAVVAGLSDERTAYFSPDVGQTLAGDELSTPVWQLGLYSDTDGWPQCGTYHEDRLWLSGSASNRVDASMAGKHFDFTPTGPDGTIADDNAIAATAAATEQNTFFWWQSVEYGLVGGSLQGEWLIRSSSLDDPLSPSSIQMRRVTTYGCANIEPQLCLRSMVFVQRQQRRVMDFDNYPYGEAAGWYADNLEHLSGDLTCSGVAEIRYQQTPSWNLWIRRNDGVLIGSAFRHAAYGKESFNGWHEHSHADDRIFESIAVGTTGVDGEGEQLYAVTNQTEPGDPDHNIRWVEVLAPEFDGCDSCDAMHLDSAPSLCCVELTGGATPTGLTIHGLWHLNGKTVQPYVGGLDLGDYTVANGSISITFGDTSKGHDAALFTWTYFQSLDTCDLFGASAGLQTETTVTPPNGPMGLMAYVGADTPVGYDSSGGYLLLDHDNNVVYQIEVGTPGTGSAGLKILEGDVPGDETDSATEVAIFGDAGGGTPNHTLGSNGKCFHPNGDIFIVVDAVTNSRPIARIDLETLTATEIFGQAGSSTATSTNGPPARILASNQMFALQTSAKDYIVSRGLISEVAVVDVTGSMSIIYAANVANQPNMCAGVTGDVDYATFFALDVLHTYGAGDSTPVVFYRYQVQGSTVAKITVRASIAPADIDATWTKFTSVSTPGYDVSDGNIIACFRTNESVTNQNYLVKLDAFTGDILWTSAIDATPLDFVDFPNCTFNGKFDYLNGSHTVVHVDLSDGSQTTTTWNSALSSNGYQVFEYQTGSVTINNNGYTQGSGPVPTYLGDYLANNDDTIPDNRWARLLSGTTYETTSTTDYPFYGMVGMTFTSRGQLLRPDFGQDGGTQAGPAFGKKRRVSQAAFALVNARGLSVGTDFDHLRTVFLRSAGGSTIASPTLFSGTIPLQDQEINDNEGFDSRICWEVTRPYPATVTAIAATVDTKG